MCEIAKWFGVDSIPSGAAIGQAFAHPVAKLMPSNPWAAARAMLRADADISKLFAI